MWETPERATIAHEQKGKSIADYLRRYRDAHRNLLKRADSLKGKDEPRRRKLLKAAEQMDKGKGKMSSVQVYRSALIAEIDLLRDEIGKGKTNGKK